MVVVVVWELWISGLDIAKWLDSTPYKIINELNLSKIQF